jgi:hypothetical protein
MLALIDSVFFVIPLPLQFYHHLSCITTNM